MPIYEYECPIHGIFEDIIIVANGANVLHSIQCGFKGEGEDKIFCYEIAERVWSVPANIQIGKPTRVFENKFTGDTQIAASEYDQPPPGFTVRELRNPIERSKFEHEEQIKLDMTNAIVTANLEAQKTATKKNRHDDINANLSRLAADSDNPSGAEAFLKAAMNRKKPKKNPRRSEVKLAVNHSDASNLSEAK